MIYLSNGWKVPLDSAVEATIHFYFHSSDHKKTSHLTIFSPSSASVATTASTSNNILCFSRRNLLTNSSGGSKETNKSQASVIVRNPISINSKRPLWKKLLFGTKKSRSIILLNVITIIYASNIAVIKDVEAFTDPAYFSAVRFAVSTIPFLPFIFQARNDVQIRIYGLELGLWVSLGHLSEALGLLTSEAGRASFISLFTVIVVPLLESMLGEIIPAGTWFGIFMSVVGICILECSGSPPNIGDLFNFISAIFFGIHTLRTEHISRKTGKESFLALLGYEVCVIALLSTMWFLMGAKVDSIPDSEGISVFWDSVLEFPWMAALYTGVFSTGLCLWGEIAAMHDVSATETVVIYGMEPLWGACFAWFVLGERWGVAGWIGAALILGGSVMAQMLGSSNGEQVRAREMKDAGKEALMVSSLGGKEKQKAVVMVRRDNIIM